MAALCVIAPAAEAQSEVAFQANTGGLFTWDPTNGPRNLTAGMAPGTSPTINNWGEIAFQADTGTLWSNRRGEYGLGMMPGTSPSIDSSCCIPPTGGSGGQIAFQADTGDLWTVDGESCNCDTRFGMKAGTSPSFDRAGDFDTEADPVIAFQANTGNLWSLNDDFGATRYGMAPGTSPSVIADPKPVVAFQESIGGLWQWDETAPFGGGTNLGAGMAPGTSSDIASPPFAANDEIAFQANNGDLWTTFDGDTGQAMAPGTSPSISADGVTAFQGRNGDLWEWDGTDAVDRHLGMMAGTSPSIQPGVFDQLKPPPKPASVVPGGPGNDRLDSGTGSDLIRGARGNDRSYGGPGNDRSYGGPGNDRSYGGGGNDFLYGGAGNDRISGGRGNDLIVDHRGATTVFAGSGENMVDVKDGRGDDRVVCVSGTITDFLADRRDRIAHSCLERLAIAPPTE